MKRTAGVFAVLTALGGCVSMDQGPDTGTAWHGGRQGGFNSARMPMTVPGVQGPWGQPVPMQAPYTAVPPGEAAARAMMAGSVPLDQVQRASYNPGAETGAMPAVPPGALQPVGGKNPAPGAVAAAGAIRGGGGGGAFQVCRTSVRFAGPEGMKVSWFAPTADSKNGFTTNYIEAPGRYNFPQGAIYRLKLSDIRNYPGVELYPTLEVVPANPKTAAFLAHSAVPVALTPEDLEQVSAGNFVVKVIYLPDPQYQDLATTALGEIVSSRLEPGVDPIKEAMARGSILLIVRLGNIDLEAPNTPPLDAPSGYHGAAIPGAMPAYGMAGQPVMPGAPRTLMGPNGPVMAAPPGQLPATLPAAPPADKQQLPTGVTPSPTSAAPPLSRMPAATGVQPVKYLPR